MDKGERKPALYKAGNAVHVKGLLCVVSGIELIGQTYYYTLIGHETQFHESLLKKITRNGQTR